MDLNNSFVRTGRANLAKCLAGILPFDQIKPIYIQLGTSLLDNGVNTTEFEVGTYKSEKFPAVVTYLSVDDGTNPNLTQLKITATVPKSKSNGTGTVVYTEIALISANGDFFAYKHFGSVTKNINVGINVTWILDFMIA